MRGFKTSDGNRCFCRRSPQNFPSSLEARARSDISWLAPEVIERIEIIKGPFSALYGDLALGGVSQHRHEKERAFSEPERLTEVVSALFAALGIFSSREQLGSYPVIWPMIITPSTGTGRILSSTGGAPFNKVSFPILGGILSLRYNYFQSGLGRARVLAD